MKNISIKALLCVSLGFTLILGIAGCSTKTVPSITLAETTADLTESQKMTTTSKATETEVIETTAHTTAAVESTKVNLPVDFPSIDSSTARIPITQALYTLFVGEYGLTGPEPICSKTHGAWLNLIDGKVDMIFAVAPTDEEKQYLNEKDVDVVMRLYGCDGLVFMGNSSNPVKNLTQDEIKGIYRGEITNWSELGGPDAKINAYYREDQSGSQRFFEDLVWKGEELPDFSSLNMYVEDDMSDITYTVISDPYAIGFNIMSYINIEFSDPNLMLFSVDGVAPSTPTLADGSYPYITQAYIIIRADEPEDSSARWMFNWFGCEKSREILQSNSSLSLIFSDPILLENTNDDS